MTHDDRIVLIVLQFEEAWRKGPPPDVREWVAKHPDYGEELLIELVICDLRYRYQSGQGISVERHLGLFPELRGNNELLVQLVVVEIVHRSQRPDRADLLERFPQIAADINALLDVLAADGPEPLSILIAPSPLPSTRSYHGGPADSPKNVPGSVAGLGPLEFREVCTIDKFLNVGSFKQVFAGHQQSTGRRVAIKMLREPGGKDAADRLRQFEQEARVQGRLDHQNIPPIILLGTPGASPGVLVEKLIDGREWSHTVRDPAVPLVNQLEVLLRVCAALKYVHDRGLIHRDVKPLNVMLSQYGEVYLVDWGFAVQIDPSISPLTAPLPSADTSSAGTPNYMAPEMARGYYKTFSRATDVFLLGSVLYEILTGSTPYRGRNPTEALRRAWLGQIEPPRSRAPHRVIPAELEQITLRALSFEPTDRYLDAGAFADAIKRYLDHEKALTLGHAARTRLEELTHEIAAAVGQRSRWPLLLTSLIEVTDQFVQARQLWGEPVEADSQRHDLGQLIDGERAARFALVDLATKSSSYTLAEAQLQQLLSVPGTEVTRVQTLRQQVQSKDARSHLIRRSVWTMAALVLVLASATVVLRDRAAQAELDRKTAETTTAIAVAEKAKAEELKAKAEAGKSAALTEAAEAEKAKALALAQAETERARAAEAELIASLRERADRATRDQFHSAAALLRAEIVARNGDAQQQALWTESFQKSLVPVAVHTLDGPANEPNGRRMALPVAFCRMADLLITGFQQPAAWRIRNMQTQTEPRLWSLPMPADGLEPENRLGLVVFSRDGRRVAHVEPDGRVLVRDVETGELIREWSGHPLREVPVVNQLVKFAVAALTWDAAGNRLATAGYDGKLRVWKLDEEEPIAEWNDESPNRTPLGYDTPLLLPRGTTSLAFDPSGASLIAAGLDGSIRLWDIAKQELSGKWQAQSGRIVSLALSDDGVVLASGGDDGSVVIWDWAKRLPLTTATLPALLSDERYGRAWDVEQGGLLTASTRGQLWEPVCGLDLSADNRLLAASQMDGTITVLDVASGRVLSRGVAHHTGLKRTVQTKLFFTKRRELLSVGGDQQLIRWNLARKSDLWRDLPRTSLIATGPDGDDWFAVDATRRHLLRGHGRAEELTKLFTLENGSFEALACGPAQVVALTSDGRALVFHRLTGSSVTEYKEEVAADQRRSQGVNALAISPDGTLAASFLTHGRVSLWKTDDGTLVQSLSLPPTFPVDGLAFRSDGAALAVGISDFVGVFPKQADGQWAKTPTGIPAPRYPHLAFLPSANRLVMAGQNSFAIQFHDLDQKQTLLRISAVDETPIRVGIVVRDARAIAIIPDGRSLVSGSNDGWLRVWDAQTGMLKAAVSTRLLEDFRARKAAPGQPDLFTVLNDGGVVQAAATGDGRTLLFVTGDDRLRICDWDELQAWAHQPGAVLRAETEKATQLVHRAGAFLPQRSPSQ